MIFAADSTGKIVLTGLADGTYEAVVSKPGYIPGKVILTVGGANADIIICKYGYINGDGAIDLSDLGSPQRYLCDRDVELGKAH